MDRRSLIIGGAALIAAPAIVRVTSLMPVKVRPEFLHTFNSTVSVYDKIGGGGSYGLYPYQEELKKARLEWQQYVREMSYVQPMDVPNWHDGDITITHATDKITFWAHPTMAFTKHGRS